MCHMKRRIHVSYEARVGTGHARAYLNVGTPWEHHNIF
jgi:hypothetical protein